MGILNKAGPALQRKAARSGSAKSETLRPVRILLSPPIGSIGLRNPGLPLAVVRLPSVHFPPSEQTQWFSDEVQPYERPLRSYLARSLPSLADVDDLVQDCYTKMLRARSAGEVRSAKGLLFTIARNAVKDFWRQSSKVVHVEITENTILPVLDSDEDVVESICRVQELALLKEAISALPERCREVLLLRKIIGSSQREIAQLLGISENTVESLAVKGARRCGEYLRARGVGPRASHHV